jgi:phage terminase large subunit
MTQSIRWRPFSIQRDILQARNDYRYRCLFAGKRGAKSECAYIDTCLKIEEKPNYIPNGVDPHLIVIIAPTHDMLQRLVWPKFTKFSKPWIKEFVPSANKIICNDNETTIYGISAEKISRMEGLKVHHIHMTEVFQMGEDAFLESLARTTDTKGTITMDGSLGPQIINPKQHWAYKRFIEKPFPNSKVWSWKTVENPYIDKAEIELLKESLDPRTYRAMFEIDWDTAPLHAVYDDFDQDNIIDSYQVNPKLETVIGIDWGWTHPMAVGFYQIDRAKDTFYKFDEIVKSKLKLDDAYLAIKRKIDQHGMTNIKWVCDIAGNQEREMLGLSNIKYFREKFGVIFKYSRMPVLKSIAIVRGYVKNSLGMRKLFVTKNCTHTIDGFKRYSYIVKDGQVQNENPEKVNDDAMDETRYAIVNNCKQLSNIEIM